MQGTREEKMGLVCGKQFRASFYQKARVHFIHCSINLTIHFPIIKLLNEKPVTWKIKIQRIFNFCNRMKEILLLFERIEQKREKFNIYCS